MKRTKIIYVRYKSDHEEQFEATSFEVTSDWVRIFRGKIIIAALATTEISRVAETKFLLEQQAPGSGREEIEKWWRENSGVVAK